MQESDAASPSLPADTDQKPSEAIEGEVKPEKGDSK
jgi:hypothetical protein